ncbi:MAG: 4Fe-4S dicluster domain-containing protein [Chloroflexota bacterium]|jgi:molybdopterin-containing oxidoreductase family iron-sulfur binding subunit
MAEKDTPQKWGLVVDLDRCTGCNACIAACSMENNIPFTGEDDVAYGRAMYWLYNKREWVGEYPEIKPAFQPVMCQQCGNAPCEPVCPVFASVHSEEEQINLAVYNRCVGTRYCANNCPYHARQFNYFDYELPEPMNSYLNPDVSVRRRGVMEKCTFCVQRIVRGRQKASAEGRAVQDGEIQPACVQACPAGALVFGDVSDPETQASHMARNQRRYQLLEELGTLPRVTYLKGGGRHGG